jgi:hypothetical protein
MNDTKNNNLNDGSGREYTRVGRSGLVCLGNEGGIVNCFTIGDVSVNGLFIIGECVYEMDEKIYGEFNTSLGKIEFKAEIKRIDKEGFGIKIYNMPMGSFMALVGEVLSGCDNKSTIKSEIAESKEKITISGGDGEISAKLESND